MNKTLCPTLVNAEAEGISCGDFAVENLQIGNQVKLIIPISAHSSKPENRIVIWVRVIENSRHPLPERHFLTGVVDEVLDLGETQLASGDHIKFSRCNIVEIA